MTLDGTNTPQPRTRVALPDLRGSCTRALVAAVADQLLSFSGKSSSSCPPPRPSTHRQLYAHRSARHHAVSTREFLSVTKGQLHLRISSRRPNVVPSHLTNLLNSPTIETKIFVASIKHDSDFLNCVALQVLKFMHHSPRYSPFVVSQGCSLQPTWRL